MPSPPADRLHVAIELHETGLAIQRQNIRRQHPELTEDQVDVALSRWLADRPVDHSST